MINNENPEETLEALKAAGFSVPITFKGFRRPVCPEKRKKYDIGVANYVFNERKTKFVKSSEV